MTDAVLIILPLVMSFLTLSALLYFSLRRDGTDLNRVQTFLIGFILIMVVSFSLELISNGFNVMLVWNVFYYIGLAGSFFCILLYSLKFLDLKKWMSPIRLGLWASIPVLLIVLVITDPSLGLYYESVSISTFGSLSYLSTVPGFGFHLYIIYCISLIVFLTYFLINEYFSAVNSNHGGVIAPVFFLCVLLANFFLMDVFDLNIPSSYSLILMITLIMVASFVLTSKIENRIASPTYKNVLQELDTGVLVLDVNDRVMFSNKMAETSLQLRRDDVLPAKLRETLSHPLCDMRPVEIFLPFGDEKRCFDIKSENLCDEGGLQKARLIILNDVNDMANFRNDLLVIQDKMKILSSITNHDIMNQLTVIMGYGELLQNSIHADDFHRKQLSAILKASRSICLQLEFMRDYQNVGKNRPDWFLLSKLIEKAHEQTDIAGLNLECQTEDREIFADPMVEKVFLNLIGNTLQHSSSAGSIYLKTDMENDNLVIIFEDDGIGIPTADKEKIFDQDFGRGSGMGLFLSRSILAITGIEIAENGIEGQGARFEIRIPKDMHRASHSVDSGL